MSPAEARPRKRWPWLLAVALLLAVAGAWFILPALRGSAPPPQTVEVRRGALEKSVSAIGKLAPKTFVDIGAQVSGQLRRITVEVGDSVAEGDLIAEIDPDVYESRAASNRAALAALEAQRIERQAGLELARAQHRRNSELVERGLVARNDFDISAAALRQAEAQLATLGAQIQQAQSNLDGDVANLGYTRVHSPIAGTVVSQTLFEGQTIVSTQTAPTLLRVADLGTMTLTAQVAEADVPRLEAGMPVYFTTLGQPDRRYRSSIRQIQPTPDVLNDVVLFRVLVDVANPDGALLPDMTAQVFFIEAEVDDALLVPMNALRAVPGEDERWQVEVLTAAGVESREIEVALSNRNFAAVADGLSEGEQVVVPTTPGGAAPEQGGRGLLGGRRR